MGNDNNREKWLALLTAWQRDVVRRWEQNGQAWRDLRLPDVSELVITPPVNSNSDVLSIHSKGQYSELFLFYGVSNGWPLWLGSFRVGIVRMEDIGPFNKKYPDSFSIAIDAAPTKSSRVVNAIELSKRELERSMVLSAPDARELVLLLDSGEICLYSFSSIRVFKDFYDFMCYQHIEVIRFIEDMLIK